MTAPLLLLSALLAGAPPAADAQALASSKSWDELYLRFAAAKAEQYSPEDRRKIGAALLEASRNLTEDAVLAAAAAEKAAELSPSAAAFLAAGEANLRLDQKSAAEKAFDRALKLDPKNGPALLARADLAMKENEPELALKLYGQVPAKSPQRKAAEKGIKSAKAAAREKANALKSLADSESGPPAPKPVIFVNEAPPPITGERPTEEQLCAAIAGEVCRALSHCVPSHPDANRCQADVEAECAKGRETVSRVATKDLEACTAKMRSLGCSLLDADAFKEMKASTPSCRAIDAAYPK